MKIENRKTKTEKRKPKENHSVGILNLKFAASVPWVIRTQGNWRDTAESQLAVISRLNPVNICLKLKENTIPLNGKRDVR